MIKTENEKLKKSIADIRIYSSSIRNIDGNSMPQDINNRKAILAARRVAMKLRENDFSLGDFDHLYINFTTCPTEDGMSLAGRSIDRYHSWYRYYDYQIDESVLGTINTEDFAEKVLDYIQKILLAFFFFFVEDAKLITESVKAAREGEQMKMKYKEKRSAKATAVVFLRLYNDGRYHPLLWVNDSEGKSLLKRELKPCSDLGSFGSIQLSSRKITIKPRQSELYSRRKPITFEFDQRKKEARAK